MRAFDDLERQLLAGVARRQNSASTLSARAIAAQDGPAIATTPRRLSKRWATVLVAALTVVVAVLVLGTAGRGPSNAFAGWSASPTAPTSHELVAAESACQHRIASVRSATPTVWETRGSGSLLVYANRVAITTCVTGRPQLGTVAVSRAASGSVVASGTIYPESIGLEFAADGQAFRQLAGKVGAGVTGVTVEFEGGSSVQATVANGWFAAWWPGTQASQSGQPGAQSLSQSVPRSFEITTAAGTTTRPLTADEIQRATQTPYLSTATGATGATGTSASGTSGASGNAATPEPSADDSALASNFAVLRQPGPSPIPLPPDLAGQFTGPVQPPNPYGLNPSLARYVAPANTWIIPGSSGVCLVTIGIVGPGVGSGSCGPTSLALAGDFLTVSREWPSNEIELVGFAPDGNTSVSVADADGSTRAVTVTDNVYVVIGGSPSGITLRDASGALTTLGLP